MRSSAILLKVIFFVALDSALILRPEKVFKHFQVVVLIYRFFEKVWSVDFSAGNPTPDQNFLKDSSTDKIFSLIRASIRVSRSFLGFGGKSSSDPVLSNFLERFNIVASVGHFLFLYSDL